MDSGPFYFFCRRPSRGNFTLLAASSDGRGVLPLLLKISTIDDCVVVTIAVVVVDVVIEFWVPAASHYPH